MWWSAEVRLRCRGAMGRAAAARGPRRGGGVAGRVEVSSVSHAEMEAMRGAVQRRGGPRNGPHRQVEARARSSCRTSRKRRG
jgi:hypothetical protein